MSVNDRIVMENAKSSLCCEYGRYQVKIPWKDDKTELPDNYDMALKRLDSTEKRLKKDSLISEAYCSNIQNYVDKGYIHKVDGAGQSHWYLPHFPVIRPDKATTKTRIVLDASATYQGIPLNQMINQGPKLQQELTDVLLRFRKNPVAVVYDIAEMYLRVEIAPTDRSYFRFLWRDMDTNRVPDVYEFSRVVFGVNCSPFLAQLVIQEHAKKHTDEFPMAAETVLKSTYMDDSMDSVLSEQDGVKLHEQLSELLKRADMYTRKWLSNSENVLNKIPMDDRATEIEIEGTDLHGAKTLGILWLAREDVFTFQFKPFSDSFTYTKRNVLKKIASLFDPLGFYHLTLFVPRSCCSPCGLVA